MVASQYPAAILNNKVCPAHLDPDIFLPLLKEIVDKRLWYKKHKKENYIYSVLEKGLKVVINTIYGLFNFKFYFLYDPYCTYRTTINNELFILMLIEDLTLNGYEILSANTDGILLKTKRNELENVRNIYREWEKLSGFTLEEAFFSKFIRKDINNYIGIKTDGEIKKKGHFVADGGLKKGVSHPIVAKALEAYYLNNVSIEDTIFSCTDIYDFCIAKKTDKKFTNILEYVKREIITTKTKIKKEIVRRSRTIPPLIYEEEIIDYSKSTRGRKTIVKHEIAAKVVLPPVTEEIEVIVPCKPRHEDIILSEQPIQQTVRFYVTKPSIDEDGNMIGYSLKKEKVLEDGKKQRIDYCAGQFIQVFNNYYEVGDFGEYNIDYEYYIDCCYKVINKIGTI